MDNFQEDQPSCASQQLQLETEIYFPHHIDGDGENC